MKSIDSTNKYALQLIAKSKPKEGTVISTEFQSAGSGQRSKIWQSEANLNLLFSTIVYPHFLEVGQQFYLSMFASNSIIHCMENHLNGKKLCIKWPNDIYYGNKKMGGILIQNVLRGDALYASVIGIGLNINQDQFDSGLPNPISLCQITEQSFNKEDLLEDILISMDRNYKELQSKKLIETKNLYESKLKGIGLETTFQVGEEKHTGTILGVEVDGRLIANVGGKIQKFTH